MKLYECPKHDQAFERNAKTCECCKRIHKILLAREARGPIEKKSKLPSPVYWPSRMGHMGRTIQNLEPTPIHFSTKKAYREYLKRTGTREVG